MDRNRNSHLPLSAGASWAVGLLPPRLPPMPMQHLRRPLVAFLLDVAPSSAFLACRGVGVAPASAVLGSSCTSTDFRVRARPRLPRANTDTSTSRGRSRISTGGRRIGFEGGRTWTWGLRGSSAESEGESDQPSWDWRAGSSWGEDRGTGTPGSNPWDDSSPSKWERIYAEGDNERQSSTFLTAMADWDKGGMLGATEVDCSLPVEVVSFDLDDTLWSTMAVINQANAVLRDHMSREHPALVEKFEIADLMKEVWKEKLAENPELDPAPVNLTELRKAGLTRACELTGTDPAPVVESCFEVWRRARHDVEPHLFPGVIDTLKALRERGVRLVAITNGNAQTEDIPCLKDLFEFCVLAEQVGERKPQSGPFKEAVKRAGYPSDNAVGGEWVHVGDDWASDCVGGKKMRMRTVLVRVPGKPAVGSAPAEDKKEEGAQDAATKNRPRGLNLDDDDDDDDDNAFPTLEDETLPADDSPEGKAKRLRQEQEKAKRKSKKLGILVDSLDDLEVAAGTAVANLPEEDETRRGDGRTASTVEAAAATADTVGQEEEEEGRRRREEEEAAKARVKRLEEEERKAREELKSKNKLYGQKQEMTAIATDHPEAAQGPGKLMSTGSSSYVVDMIMKDFMDASLDNITEVVGLVDEWRNNASSTSTSYDGEDRDEDAAAATAAVEAGRDRSGGGGATDRRSGGDKFCASCGVKIPAAFKFCPECGAEQETLAA